VCGYKDLAVKLDGDGSSTGKCDFGFDAIKIKNIFALHQAHPHSSQS
jgi:hypothetical protein